MGQRVKSDLADLEIFSNATACGSVKRYRGIRSGENTHDMDDWLSNHEHNRVGWNSLFDHQSFASARDLRLCDGDGVVATDSLKWCSQLWKLGDCGCFVNSKLSDREIILRDINSASEAVEDIHYTLVVLDSDMRKYFDG